jgi:hypothetical protein
MVLRILISKFVEQLYILNELEDNHSFSIDRIKIFLWQLQNRYKNKSS